FWNAHFATMNELIETRQAVIKIITPELLEVRYRSGQTLDRQGLQDVIDERERICGGASRQGVLAIFPPDIGFEMEVMTQDHYKDRIASECTQWLAVA